MTIQARLNTADLSPRARELVVNARQLLEQDGPEGLSMRRLGQRLGISAPALYRYFPDKRTLENAIIFDALLETGELFLTAIDGRDGDALAALYEAYRAWGIEHPHLYHLLYARPLDRDLLDPSAEDRSGAAVRAVAGDDPVKARALWVYAHGMVLLEIDGRLPPDTDLDELWSRGVAAFG